ncbi:hypothetical protein J8H63_00145 [Staphylococcus chromogenes]|uniref:hypothetical protein n=1 Tax=Staphylococcus chromogenes TaxID=46126 RepID=UPI000DF9E32B|nr:hypothetical protein [Staphylococcus chromogenes]MBP0044974.1 hypothetical protein [Staphylococcus chromogenes]GGI30927.1 hypothetical protein GCM10008139_06790 [Staphylococcus chromogenes]SUM13387.1 Uncharacterised protein [Staphylococcus chromogenes]
MHILVILLSLLSIALLTRNYYLTKYIDELEYTMLTLARRVLSEDNIDKLIK